MATSGLPALRAPPPTRWSGWPTEATGLGCGLEETKGGRGRLTSTDTCCRCARRRRGVSQDRGGGAEVFREHGAVAVVEAWGDDVPEGKVTSFPMAVKLEEGETVVFSWVPLALAGGARGRNAKVMADPRCSRRPGRCPSTGNG